MSSSKAKIKNCTYIFFELLTGILSALLSSYAEMIVSSEDSLKILLDKIPECKLNGEKLNCRFATRQNLSMFEDIANLRKSTNIFRSNCLIYMQLQRISKTKIFLFFS